MFVRPINFIDYFEINDIQTEFSANLFLYDVDRDNDIELIIGNWDTGDLQSCGEADVEHRKGELNIIKYGIPWKKVLISGIVSCISAGNITERNYPDILVFCSNCICYFYSIAKSEMSDTEKDNPQMHLIHEQTIAPNAKNIVIDDFDKDGINEIIVGFSDRVVRMYKWIKNELLETGFLIEIMRWDLCSQIGGLTLHCSPKYGTQIIASLTGGSYAVLFWTNKFEDNENKKIPYIDYKSMSDEYKDNLSADIRSEIIGNIRRCNAQLPIHNSGDQFSDCTQVSGQTPYFAVCTIDGQVMLMDEDEKIWQVHLGRGELFGLSKVDITKNDDEEVVVCSWEGVTYIINHRREIARFYPKHQCQAFLSGSFAVSPGNNQPVMIYSTFENSLIIYYNLNLNRIPARSLLQDLPKPLKDKIKEVGINVNDKEQMQKFIHERLYKWPTLHKTNDTHDFFETASSVVMSPLLDTKSKKLETF